MSLPFWNNPEFVRHRRAELRTTRAIAIAVIVLFICVLIWLGCWVERATEIAALHRQSQQFGNPAATTLMLMDAESPTKVWASFFVVMMFAQLGILTFWSLLCCAQSVSAERERKTWDFQRAARLTPQELLVGKLLGEPVLVYFIAACCLPITLIAAALGHQEWRSVLAAYFLILLATLFVGLVGLWMSSLFETRSRGVGLIGTFGLYLAFGFAGKLTEGSHFPGLAAFGPVTGLTAILDNDGQGYVATIFGSPVSWLLMSALLYFAFGSWFVLMLLRVLKKDFDQIRPLSRWQSVACAAFLNFTFYALFNPGMKDDSMSAHQFATLMVFINAIILFAMGVATITSYERLKVWWRTQRQKPWFLFAEDGPPWPWLVLSAAIAYLWLVWGLYTWKNALGFNRENLEAALVQFLVVLVYVTRDVLFIQWSRLTHMRAPVLKGFLYVCLYYIAAAMLFGVFTVRLSRSAPTVLALFTPAGVLVDKVNGFHNPMAVFVGLAIQMGIIVVLLAAISARVRHSAVLSAATSAAD